MNNSDKLHRDTEKYLNKKEQKKDGKVIYKILLCFFLVVFGISTGIYIGTHFNKNKAENKYNDMQNEVNNTGEDAEEKETEATKEPEYPEKNLSFSQLRVENEDIYAWIYVPGTQVDYPVLQHSTNDMFYLMHNLDKSYGYPGCIYTEMKNAKDFSDKNTVLYGHNMEDGSMFRTLHRYEDRTFFDENYELYVYTENCVYIYEIFAAYNYSNVHLLNGIDISSDEGFTNYLNDIKGTAGQTGYVRSNVELDVNDKIITLSTCQGNSDMRYLVQGVLKDTVSVNYG